MYLLLFPHLIEALLIYTHMAVIILKIKLAVNYLPLTTVVITMDITYQLNCTIGALKTLIHVVQTTQNEFNLSCQPHC